MIKDLFYEIFFMKSLYAINYKSKAYIIRILAHELLKVIVASNISLYIFSYKYLQYFLTLIHMILYIYRRNCIYSCTLKLRIKL